MARMDPLYRHWNADQGRHGFTQIWRQQFPATPHSAPTRVLPSHSCDLVFNFGDPFERVGDRGSSRLPAIHLVGPLTRYLAVRATGSTDLLIGRMPAWSLFPLFGVPAEALTDQVVALSDLPKGRWVTEVERFEAESIHLHLTSQQRPIQDPGLVCAALRRIQASSGQTRTSALAADLGVSRRHLCRLFQRSIGYGPKSAASLARFHNAIALLVSGLSGAALAAEAGYADQPHLIRSITQRCGLSPSQILKLPDSALKRRFNHSARSQIFKTVYL